MVGCGRIDFLYVNLKRNPGFMGEVEGFDSYPVDESYRALVDEEPAFGWGASTPGFVEAWCPVWFPGAVVGGLLLGWGLLRGRAEEDPEGGD